MAKQSIKKCVRKLADLAIETVPSPVAFMFHTPNDCGISREEMQAFLKGIKRFHKKSKKPFGYICVTEQKYSKLHYHGIAFVSGRDYGHQRRFESMLNKQRTAHFPESKPAWVTKDLFRLSSQLDHFLERAKYLDKKACYPDLAKHEKRYWSSSTVWYTLPTPTTASEANSLGESEFELLCFELI